jgi:hypothetical protein
MGGSVLSDAALVMSRAPAALLVLRRRLVDVAPSAIAAAVIEIGCERTPNPARALQPPAARGSTPAARYAALWSPSSGR